MQILIVVIMAVVYGLGGILKSAKSKKLEGKKDRQQQGRPFDSLDGARDRHAPRFAPNDGASQGKQDSQPRPSGAAYRRVYEATPTSQPERPKADLAMPAVRHPVDYGTARPEPVTLKPVSLDVMPEVEKLPEYKRARAAVPAEIDEATFPGEPLLDASDPEALRRAILHYEILGKPLSLR